MPAALVRMYATGICPYCIRAEALLRSKDVTNIEIIRIDLEPARRQAMIEETGARTVPQIFIGATHVGGCDDLVALDHAGELDAMLRRQP